MNTDIGNLDGANEAEEERFWRIFESKLANDDGAVADGHLAAGRAIYVAVDEYPGKVVRQNPDGSRDLMELDLVSGELHKLRSL